LNGSIVGRAGPTHQLLRSIVNRTSSRIYARTIAGPPWLNGKNDIKVDKEASLLARWAGLYDIWRCLFVNDGVNSGHLARQ
jgi:hypothetical protein